ncbi:MAG: hypothetical protein Q8O84_00420 [Nanoarchaeota archaeon]|nr:hypothetical protein [Nanoarchaeota archaeon]
MKFIEKKSKVVFGIALMSLIAGFFMQGFLTAQLTEVEGISSKDYSYEGENVEIQGDVIACKEGFENCKLQISSETGKTITLELTPGAKYDPASGKISVIESGANFTINGNSFSNIKSGHIFLNQNTGEISEAKFTTNADGGTYDFGVVSFSAMQGNIDFSLDKRSLILPKDSTLQDFNSELFFQKFENEGLIVEGKNLEISDELSNKIFGNPQNNFKRFSGKIGFDQAKESINIEKGILKKAPDKYFIFVPEKETISFPDVGINVEAGLGKTFILFSGHEEIPFDLESIGRPGSYALKEENFIIESKGYPGYVSLSEDKVYMNSVRFGDGKSTALTFNKNSHYAGFDVGENGHFSFTLDAGNVGLSEGKINVFEGGVSPVFQIEDDGDAFESIESPVKGIGFKPGKGQIKTTPVGFEIINGKEKLLSIPNPEFYEKGAEEGLMPKQLYFASFSKEYPVVYIEKSGKFTLRIGKGEIITLSEAYQKRSEIATYYYNALFEK